MYKKDLLAFIKESNMIEGINIDPEDQLHSYEVFLDQPSITVLKLQTLVEAIQPGNVLREFPGLNVRVGDYIAPYGGPEIRGKLVYYLSMANGNTMNPYEVHQRYESLHPFTDGNGRSGRALWLWQTIKFGYMMPINGSFLHTYYYSSLSNERK